MPDMASLVVRAVDMLLRFDPGRAEFDCQLFGRYCFCKRTLGSLELLLWTTFKKMVKLLTQDEKSSLSNNETNLVPMHIFLTHAVLDSRDVY